MGIVLERYHAMNYRLEFVERRKRICKIFSEAIASPIFCWLLGKVFSKVFSYAGGALFQAGLTVLDKQRC
jgi:hypothetical protein